MITSQDKRNISSDAVEVNEQDVECDADENGGLRIDEEIYIPPPAKVFCEVDTTGPRLIITQIVNENFKSYAGTHVIGPFHKSFSAVVGPNGSGKSNVIDSMLFVFGYRASKIRSKKISVLIHNSSNFPNLNSCTVSVHFQIIIDKPGEEYEVVPNSKFVISRTAFKDSSSYYELNKKKVQFNVIAKFLRSHGVDLDHNRFLILQGEVEQIAMMKPKGQNENDTGMLEFLENIIGTSRYQEPLEKLADKVEILTERRVEKLHRLRIVQKEKATLEEPMQEAVQYLKMENTIIRLQHQLYHCKRSEAEKELNEHVGKNDSLNKELAELIDEMKSIGEQKEEKLKVIKEKSKKWEVLQQQKDEATTKFDQVRKKDESLHAELVETNKRRKANIASTKMEKNKLEELVKVPEKNAKDIEECKHLIETHVSNREKEEASLATLMAGLRKKTEPLLNERSELEKKLISLRKNVDQAKAAYDIQQSELELYTSVERNEKEKLKSLQESVESTANTLKERQKQLVLFETKIPISERSLKQAQNELDEVKAREAEKTAELKKMRITFEEQRSAMQASKSRNRILDSLMREKREGRIPGIFGRLGDLGAIDAKYDIAVSTACGPLDNIVVDTVATAQACITHLRQHDIGRATFIALEKQQQFLTRCGRKIQTPENVHRLFDLIKVEDDRVLPAFYYGLQDTLLAQDLDQATRIAYGATRYRVVTLKGELIELSGTMSGGGRTALRGRIGQKIVRNEPSSADIEKLQSQLDAVFDECNSLKAKQPLLEQQIHVLTTALRDMRIDRKKFGIEVQTLREQEPLLREQLKVQEKKVAESVSDSAKVAKLQKAVDGAKSHLDQVEESSALVEKEVERINKKIDDISGNRVRDQQAKIAQLTKSVDKAKAEICRLQVAIKTAERNAKKTEKQIETLESDVKVCEQNLRDIQKEKSELEERAKTILDKLEKINEALAERDDNVSSMKNELNALQAREDKMKAVKIDLNQKLHESKKVLKELQQIIPEYNRKIVDLKLRVIPHETQEPLKDLTEEEIDQLDAMMVMQNLQKTKKRLPEQIPNMQIIEDYQEKDALYIRHAADLEEMTLTRNKMRDLYETARRRRVQEFLHGFNLITTKLKEMYRMITLGGDAELELVDSLDPFSEGIVFSVRPPKKSWKSIGNLSGGEKTLSSLALIFALHHYKPTPLYFMDEIDAALDFKNVSIIGNYIKERTKNAQFIVISLRTNMFELADCLVGVYKTFNCSKSVTLYLRRFYENNDITPSTQLTSRMYATQASQAVSTQRVEASPRDKNTTSTTNDKNASNTQSNEEKRPSAENNIANQRQLNDEQLEVDECGLPDLAVCATPQKISPQHSSRIARKSMEKEDKGLNRKRKLTEEQSTNNN
ncbi:structural maintenance of chromosomes protein 4 [Linepithema humile]|uniref:structural maintenance of chromosomes protein 4 n=1 Tax=Linepithema humile TaxID=83485 RepID=UPI0006237A0D|nr:PREDICTED: structural maintenance of chromosomes protein 4 [Linepithema humile]XP_012234510.1 PREDICTED: structural maintenance of chromosomes protein 4 [Linepithema humile]XP_012234511.1 PREDICTED: structural maintenance of chromosomes protein 4 [Linepithema humile]XP_012234512.1 PREDICTED: structural maintenance of chromosomes protein 4 [Linepithema humile]